MQPPEAADRCHKYQHCQYLTLGGDRCLWGGGGGLEGARNQSAGKGHGLETSSSHLW